MNKQISEMFLTSVVAERQPKSEAMHLTVYPEEQAKIAEWLEKVAYPKIIAQQKEKIKDPSPVALASWERGQPFEGCMGGGLTYMLTPTTIGMVVKVKHALLDEEYDATNYDCW